MIFIQINDIFWQRMDNKYINNYTNTNPEIMKIIIREMAINI